MITLQIPKRKWKIAAAIGANEEDTCEWVAAELRREQASYPIDTMRRPDGEMIEISQVDDNEIPRLLKSFETFKAQWTLRATELGLLFEVDEDLQEWLDELAKQQPALSPV